MSAANGFRHYKIDEGGCRRLCGGSRAGATGAAAVAGAGGAGSSAESSGSLFESLFYEERASKIESKYDTIVNLLCLSDPASLQGSAQLLLPLLRRCQLMGDYDLRLFLY